MPDAAHSLALSAARTGQPTDTSRTAGTADTGIRSIQVPRRFVADEWGGTETTILQSSRALNAAGHPTRIFTTLALSDRRREHIQDIEVLRHAYCYPFFGLSRADRHEMDKKGGNLLSLSLLVTGVDV